MRKTFSTKLKLHRETVKPLDFPTTPAELREVAGGVVTFGCPTSIEVTTTQPPP